MGSQVGKAEIRASFSRWFEPTPHGSLLQGAFFMSVITITLGFVPARIWKESAKAYAETRNKDLPYKHYFVDQHYPLDKERNRKSLRKICLEHGIEVLDPGKNLGLHEGFNWALKQINPPDDAIIIAYDPDVYPTSSGWDMALVRAIRGDQFRKIVWASLLHAEAEKEIHQRGFEKRMIDGYIEVLITKLPVMNSICAWSYKWLREVGFLTEPRPFYGHLESAMFNRLRGNQWAFLPQWSEDERLRHTQDKKYMMYKWAHAHRESYDGDFESWLKAGCPMPEGEPTE